MKRLVNRLFRNRTLGYKFTLMFALVILIPMLLLAYVSYRVMDSRLIIEANNKLKMGLKTAWTEYYIRADQMRYGMLQAASQKDVIEAVRRHDSGRLKEMMQKWKGRRPYVDIWIILDSKGRVISRFNNELKDDAIDINGLVEKVVSSGKTQVSTEILAEDILDREGEEFHRQVAPPKDIMGSHSAGVEGDVMALIVVTPVIDDSLSPIGAIITADVLNKDRYLPDAIANKLPWLFTTVSMNGLRIATNIKGSDGQAADWTFLPGPVLSKISSGKALMGEWEYLGQDFISAFEPIEDNKGKSIGSLDVGMPKSQLWAIQNENLIIIAVITFFGLALSLIVASITTSRIIKPLKVLKEKADAFANGDMDAKIDVDMEPGTEDELKILAYDINAMINEVRSKNSDKEQHLRELNDKNSRYMELVEKLKATNEELEVSYEEVQSQTEEMSAANEELRIVNEELKNKNDELQGANDRVRREEEEQKRLMLRLIQAEKLSSLGEIISGVAHELNNPLTTIMGFSELLIEKECHADVAKKRLKMINESSHRCKQIIDNLLTFARSYKLEKRYCDINRVITDTLELKEYQLRVSNIDIEIDLEPALPRTMLDEHQFQQVFLNLINNAHHSMAEKGKGGRISISTGFDGDTIRAKVSDTGKGMSDDIAKKIFDPFFTTKEVGEGTGLGLSISYGIIKEHGGNIYATGKPGEGATFVIELPIIEMEEESQSPSPAKSPTQLTAKGRRALTLDDEPAILGILKEVLSNAGFHVDTANSGYEALEMLNETAYDLIISDIKMAGMDGKEFYKRLRTKRPEAARKLIFISGDTISQETQNFLKETGNIFLKKPFTLEGLRAVISKHPANLNPKNLEQ